MTYKVQYFKSKQENFLEIIWSFRNLHSMIHGFINIFKSYGHPSTSLKITRVSPCSNGMFKNEIFKRWKSCIFSFKQYFLKPQKLLKFCGNSSSRNNLVIRVIFTLYGKMFQGTTDHSPSFDMKGRNRSLRSLTKKLRSSQHHKSAGCASS